jgi:hypothetical protein
MTTLARQIGESHEGKWKAPSAVRLWLAKYSLVRVDGD